jgi:ABC-2 type transport system permease protein
MLLGTVLWTFFQETTTQGMFAIVDRGDLLRKIAFPKYIILLATTLNALINLGINLVIVLVFGLINGVQLTWTVIFVIPLLLELFLFSFGVALFLSTAFVKFRDIGPVWEILSQALFYGTPIIYPISLVIQMSPKVANFLMLNPLAQIISDMRNILTWSGTPTIWTMARIWWGITPIVITLVVFAFGSWVFNKNSARFAEVL